jgi:gas vesicle protein GvpN
VAGAAAGWTALWWRTAPAGGRQTATVHVHPPRPREAVLSTDAPLSDPALATNRVTHDEAASVRDARARIAGHLVGRGRELDLLLAAVAAGRDMLLEGPPGTSKSTLLRASTAEWGIPLLFVEGNADLTPSRLVGHHNPARVLREDYSEDNFVAGPLVEAMRSGGFLYVEEFNRAPEDTLNTLLTAMAERRIAVHRVGTVESRPTFRVIASMNPYDNIGTTRLSTSVHDRLCRLSVDYQDAEAERGIVVRRTGIRSPRLVADAVALTRATREREDVQQGSSVRGAIDVALIAAQLATMRGVELPDDSAIDPPRGLPEAYTDLVLDAMVVGLSGRIHLDETIEETPEDVLRQIWEDHFLLSPAAAQPG